jgi:hypothetical protein
MCLSCHQNAGQNRGTKIANRCFENAAEFIYLEMAITNQNLFQKAIKRSMNSSEHFVFIFVI